MSQPQDRRDLDSQRREYAAKIATALKDEEDPLAVYVQFVQWITKNYGENDLGLAQVLKEATETFKRDDAYRSDLRYLKLWVLLARQCDLPTAINTYASLAKLKIGVTYSLLYEEYAKSLERVGRIGDAERIYKHGIKHQARPLERLKTAYQTFRSRNEVKLSAATQPSSHSSSSIISSTVKPYSSSQPSTASSRYALMLEPLPPERRPEKLNHNFSLLWTPEHGEYCAAEARARSMGLLGKKWTPLPIGSLVTSSVDVDSPSSSTIRVVFDDDAQRPTRTMGYARRKSMLNGEPTVTINTKEALADVFGMYNSPDKTIRVNRLGSKYAPTKKIEPVITPRAPPPVPSHPLSRSFKPFVDEAEQKENKPKFMPFVDSEASKTPSTSRAVLSTTSAPPITPGNQAERPSENVFSRVFTPASSSKPPLRDVFTEAIGKPQAKPLTHERAKSFQDVSTTPFSEPHPPTFIPLDENQRTPFRVFSRPEGENAFTPKASAFTPSAKPAFTPFRDDAPQRVSPVPAQVEAHHIPEDTGSTSGTDDRTDEYEEAQHCLSALAEPDDDDDDDDYGSSFIEDEYEQPVGDNDYETPIEGSDAAEVYDDGEYSSDVPLGGRWGQFNVMTPITERTFEYTSTRSVFTTPSGSSRPHGIEEGVEEDDMAENVLDPEGLEDVESDWHPNGSIEPWKHISQLEDDTSTHDITGLQERTGQLSLGEALRLSSNFRPTNPCNPFDLSNMSTLLSLMPSDEQYHDLRHLDANLLDGLQKFAKKLRKTSAGSNQGVLETSSSFSLSLEGCKYLVVDKLGEGGFGAVFQAHRIEEQDSDEDTEMDFDVDGDENNKTVALKVVRPRNLWEYHVLRKLHSVLPPLQRRSVVIPHSLFAFHDESFLVMEYCSQGTLLSVVTRAVSAGVSQQGACLDELLVVFFAVEITRVVESMHSVGFIHGDLKIDNCLLRLEDVPGGASMWGSVYEPTGEHGWACKGIKLIDFGRTINTRIFPVGQQFIADWPADERDCLEIRESRPWTYQTDYFGLAGIVYCLLYGKYIQASSIILADGRFKVATPFKRYWQTELWGDFFDILLNPCLVADGKLPITSDLSGVRRKMEEWLQANCNRTSGTLKGLLKKVEMSCLR